MFINFPISLIKKRFFRSFDRQSNKTVTLSELLQDINNFSKKIADVIRNSHEFSFKIARVIMWRTGSVATRFWIEKESYDQNLYSG